MQATKKTAIEDAFFLAHSQGFNVLPIKQDKHPCVPFEEDGLKSTWGHWQTKTQTLEEVKWLITNNKKQVGIGVITGRVSGGLESIDFDQMGIYQEYLDAAKDTPIESIIARIRAGYEEKTPNGIHWIYKITNMIGDFPSSEKWAFKGKCQNKQGNEEPKIAIETRGQGGYIVTAPSLDGKYKLLSGSLDKIVSITYEEREQLKNLAQMLSEKDPDSVQKSKNTNSKNQVQDLNPNYEPPIAQWNREKIWDELVTQDGFTKVCTIGTITKWHYHLSENKVSAISGAGNGSIRDTFTCFTTNAPHWIKIGRAMSKFDYVLRRDYGDDFNKALDGISQILGKPVKTKTLEINKHDANKPSLLITVNESQVIKDALEILQNDPFLYIKAGRVVSPMIQAKKPTGGNKTKLDGKLSIVGVETAFIRARLMEQARLYKEIFTRKGEVLEEPSRCPEWLPNAISATAINGEMNPIRTIEGILAGPVIDEDGNLINNAGYCIVNGYGWYQSGMVPGLELNEDLSQKSCSDAAHRLLNLLCDFEFQDQNLDPVKWLSCLLSQLSRQLYQNCPLYIFSANVGGAGKTHLAKSIGLISHGSECVDPEWPEAKEKREDEMGKMNAGYAFSGTTLVNYDNVPDGMTLASSVFEKQLTSPNIYHRENHKHTEIGGRNFLQWMVTGNNVRPNGFLAIRSLVTTLQSTSANPASLDPSCFTHGDFLQHIKTNRVSILQDALSILAGYIRAGKPEQPGNHLARFEGWLKIPCNAVRWATGIDPLKDHKKVVMDADSTAQALEMLAMGWMEAFPDGPVRSSKIFNLVTGGNQDTNTENIREAITMLVRTPLKNVNQISPALHRFKGRVIEIENTKYKLEITKDSDSGSSLFSFHLVG